MKTVKVLVVILSIVWLLAGLGGSTILLGKLINHVFIKPTSAK